jgi:hypothetical protein
MSDVRGMNRRPLLAWQQYCGHGRRRVLAEGNDGSRLRHDTSLYAALR